ncbi:MAG: 2-phospho-L-lactate guanylyltransferase [Candidatus Rokuibacteriota bacterium]
MRVAAVPVKDLVNAKQRLIAVLTPAERMELARAMLRDVLSALTGAGLDAVWVVSRDAEVSAIARRAGAEVLSEGPSRGHTAAVALAQAAAVRRRARLFLTVPGDVPCATAAELAALVEAAASATPSVVFTPSRSGRGTNGAALVPPDVMPLVFGEPSFDNHLAVARTQGLAPRVLRLRGLELDVDEGNDLRALLKEGPRTESGRLVASWGFQLEGGRDCPPPNLPHSREVLPPMPQRAS